MLGLVLFLLAQTDPRDAGRATGTLLVYVLLAVGIVYLIRRARRTRP